MKRLIAPALLAVLALTGCSAPATPAPTTTPGVPIARLNEAQKTSLMADLAKVNPQIEGTHAVVSASIACRSILKGEPEQVQVVTTQERFSRSADKPISEAEAKRIIEIIKTNGFCVKA